MLIEDAGFDNILPADPLYSVIGGDLGQELDDDQATILSTFLGEMQQLGTAEIWNVDHFMALFGMSDPRFVRAMVTALLGFIEASEADAVVDFWNPYACIAARVAGRPLITVIQSDIHPQSNGFMWWRDPPPQIPTPLGAANEVRAEFGLPAVGSIGELLLGDLTLVVGIPELDPLPDTADVTYVGAVLWQRHDADPPAWAGDLDPATPVVWLYPGKLRYAPMGLTTSFDSAVVLEACVEALADEPLQVVLTTGHHELPPEFASLPANFRHEPYVPGLWMADRSDLLIHHGGYGSCQTGLYAGTPALIIPTYSERESNARRIAAQGAGDLVLPETDISGTSKHVRPEAVRAKVFEILADPSFTENARRVSALLRTYGGAAEAASSIERFLGSRPGS